jgi:DNA-binding beta-propeller fold protein YncE/mono/diheme cytochrome c family protein
MRTTSWVVLLAALLLFALVVGSKGEPPAGHVEPHRSPVALALLPGGRLALTANETADSASLVDLQAGHVLAEQACGRRPCAVAVSADGARAAVSNLWSGTLTLLEVGSDKLHLAGTVAVGAAPRGLLFAPDGATLDAAVGNEVVQVNWTTRQIARRWPAPREPRHLARSSDGRWFAAASTRSAEVRCWDVRAGRLHWERKIEDGFNLRGLAFTPDGQAVVCVHAVRRDFPVARENIEQGWVIDSRLTRFPLPADATPAASQAALDVRGKAVGDPDGLAFSPDGRVLAVCAGGTHEVLLLDAALPWNAGDPGDFVDAPFANASGKYRRVTVGGRPLALAFTDAGAKLVVANHLLDAVQLLDVRAGTLTRTIPLGGPSEPSLARRGEALFHDAQRSHHQWFSCNTCHVDGHTCGLTFDTLNDESFGNPKLTPSLHGVVRTGPWTWHGWQTDLGAGVEKSFTETMFGPRPTAEETRAVVAFLATLDHPPRPAAGGEAVQRGAALFRGKAHCSRCHKGDDYTSEGTYDVKLEPDGSPYLRWNPPTLRGLIDRGPYLHDGRAQTLDELLQTHHAAEKLGGEELTPAERDDLVQFLRSL